jgi:hypothetical protein
MKLDIPLGGYGFGIQIKSNSISQFQGIQFYWKTQTSKTPSFNIEYDPSK